MNSSNLWWSIFLGLGFPLLALILAEAAAQFKRHQHPLADALQKIRQYVLPPLAVLLVMTHILELAEADGAIRIVQTITWFAVIIAALPFLNAILTTRQPIQWQLRVPNLFFQVARAVVILGIGYHILSGVWQIDLSSLATAAGVGSLVIALALQDTLSNLVSGLLLLVSRPFKVGDWIEFGGTKGRVIEQNWWGVTLENRGWEKVINVPNGVLSSAQIENFGDKGTWCGIDVEFSYDDPPNKVLAALGTLSRDFKEAGLNQAAYDQNVYVNVNGFGSSGISYGIWFNKIPDKAYMQFVNYFYSRIYALAQREGFTIPYPISVEYSVDASKGIPNTIPSQLEDTQPEIESFLSMLPCFQALDQSELEQLLNSIEIHEYARGELILQEGQPADKLYILRRGSVERFTKGADGTSQSLGRSLAGTMFGEMAIFSGDVSSLMAITQEDSQVILVPSDVVVYLAQGDGNSPGNSQFANELLHFLDEQKQDIQSVKELEKRAGAGASKAVLRQFLTQSH